MKAVVQKVALQGFRRVIAISDIHGNFTLFEKLLRQVEFSDADALVLLGDYIERGKENLPTLRYIMQLAQKPNVFVLMGNCDMLLEDIRVPRYRHTLIDYMSWRPRSILNEMCAELGIPVTPLSDEDEIRERILAAYGAEIAFLGGLPQILESEALCFAHAGLTAAPLDTQDADACMAMPAFLETAPSFEKYLVIGHWPTVNYTALRGWRLDHAAYIDHGRRIVSIDGGNCIKASGQLNAMLYAEGCITFAYADELPQMVVEQAQQASSDPLSIVFAHSEVQVLRQEDGQSFVRHLHSGRELWLPNTLLQETEKGFVCNADYTDYFLPLEKGDCVSIVCEGMPKLVKHKGVVGWYRLDAMPEDTISAKIYS